MWDMRGGAPSQRHGGPPPMMDSGFPTPSFPEGPASPPPFYAPNGPGPLTSTRGSRSRSGSKSTRMPEPSVPTLPVYATNPPDDRQREHRQDSRHKHRHQDPQVVVPNEAPRAFPHFVNQNTPKPGLMNPGFMDPNLMNPGQHHSTHVHERRRTHSQGHSQGPVFNINQGTPSPGFGGPNVMNTVNHHSTQTKPRHERSRTYSQGHSPGLNINQGIPNPGFANPGFTDPNAMNSGRYHYHSTQESTRHEHRRHRSHSHDRRPQMSSSPNRPLIMTATHVEPLPIPSPSPSQQPTQPAPQYMMPPPDPRHIRTQSMPGGKHALSQVFQYSRCTGRKKALCIGINYQGQENELRGCVNDAKNVHKFLIDRWGYKSGDIVLLTDDASDRRQIPTRKNMIDAMRWLVHGAKCHDALFFHYSGHGGQTQDLDGDEIDGFDEVIFPVDYARAGHIIDDELHKILVKSLPQGCRLTGLFDSCHSGTALDLPYVYHSNGRLKGNQVNSSARMAKSTPADVISWCACEDNQTSADTTEAGKAVGAMSYAFMLSLKQNPNQSYSQLLKSVREILRKRYSQKSQLSSSHPIDTNLRFVM